MIIGGIFGLVRNPVWLLWPWPSEAISASAGRWKNAPFQQYHFYRRDSLCNLWVATMNGICLYDRGSDSFRTLSNNGKPIYVASYLLVEGGILLGGSGAIYKYVYATKSWNLCIMRKTLFIQSLLADDTLWWREYPAQFTLARHIFLQYEDVWSEENRVVYRK